MDPLADEQLDYGDKEYGGAQKMQYHGRGAISALAEDAEDDDFDDLYSDVNVGDGFLLVKLPEVPVQSVGAGSGGFQPQKNNAPELKVEAGVGSQEPSITGVAIVNSGFRFPEHNEGLTVTRRPDLGTADVLQKNNGTEMSHNAQAGNSGFRGSLSVLPKPGVEPIVMLGKGSNEPAPLPSSGTGSPGSDPQMPANAMGTNVNINRPMLNENQIRSVAENGSTMLFVGELHWWTTDSELESVLSQYGRVKEIKFFDERASGKSKGYCQVEFYNSAAAVACNEGMNGHVFNGRACVVAFASPQTVKQMGASYMNKTQVQPQFQPQGRRPMNDGMGRGTGTNSASGDAGRNYGRGGWGRGGQGFMNRGPGGGPGRGRGGANGAKNMVGNAPVFGNGASRGAFAQGIAGPAFGGPPGGLMPPQGMISAGFDPTYTGWGAGYGGFPGPAFPGMLPPFPAVNTMGLGGVAPHVNPAFFGGGMAANGMGMMGTAGMDGHHAGLWIGSAMGGWGGEEHGQRTRESSYSGEDGASEYGYGEASHDKGPRSNTASREKERVSERDQRDWSGNTEKSHRDKREQERDRYDWEHRYREDRDGYRDHRHKDPNLDYQHDWDRGQSSSRSRSRTRGMVEEDHRSRSRDADYGKHRLPTD